MVEEGVDLVGRSVVRIGVLLLQGRLGQGKLGNNWRRRATREKVAIIHGGGRQGQSAGR
jgi:hypothetical protein